MKTLKIKSKTSDIELFEEDDLYPNKAGIEINSTEMSEKGVWAAILLSKKQAKRIASWLSCWADQ